MGRVVFDHVTKRFGDVTAVDDLDLEVADQEFLVLVGPSGCGKTTALRMLAGLEDPTEGDIVIGDRVVTEVAHGQSLGDQVEQVAPDGHPGENEQGSSIAGRCGLWFGRARPLDGAGQRRSSRCLHDRHSVARGNAISRILPIG